MLSNFQQYDFGISLLVIVVNGSRGDIGGQGVLFSGSYWTGLKFTLKISRLICQ